MTVTTDNHAGVHRWQGTASFVIGAASIIFNLLLVGMIVSGTEPPGPMKSALQVLSIGMLCASLIGIALGIVGIRDRLSRNLYPRLGLTLNLATMLTLAAVTLIGLWINP